MIIVLFILGFSIWYILRNMYDDKMEKDPTIQKLKTRLSGTFPELNKVKLMKGSESATINKYRIYLCTDFNGETYDTNVLTYVLLHELAHVITPEIGHGDTFKDNFKKLLSRAVRANLYDADTQIPVDYCGIKTDS